MRKISRYSPLLRNSKIRFVLGLVLLVASVVVASVIVGKRRFEVSLAVSTIAWLLSVFLTDKYVHKYPQRYFTYLIASHLKAVIVMAFFLLTIGWFAGSLGAQPDIMWSAFVIFVLVDALVSVPCRRDVPAGPASTVDQHIPAKHVSVDQATDVEYSINSQAILRQIKSSLDKPLVEFIEKHLPDLPGSRGDVMFIDDVTKDDASNACPVDFLVGRTKINDVRRLNQYLQFCVRRVSRGGYFVIEYMPLENVTKNLKRRYPGPLYWPAFIIHFTWYRALRNIPWLDTLYFSAPFSWIDNAYYSFARKRNRVLSKAEVWGRLSFFGLRVIAESDRNGNGDRQLIAQRIDVPKQNKKPSYYPIVALEKVGLDGHIIRTHKIRTMFPFSEFLQKRIFEDNGLASSGKFNNDFRLTEIGQFLRRYWLDELPQLFNWLRGEIKLVGIRATSQHFLSLYPKSFLDLYVNVKPGLVPPIFDESTTGFEQIVDVEMQYLTQYMDRPLRTDARYLAQTFSDIFIRGVRSK